MVHVSVHILVIMDGDGNFLSEIWSKALTWIHVGWGWDHFDTWGAKFDDFFL